jgi:3-deoxy-7-phosphoheptulonate synthase
MGSKKIADVNVSSFKPLITPLQIRESLPMTPSAIETVLSSREILENILAGRDKRKFLIVGPCSIHDPSSALHYAEELLKLSREVHDTFVLVMRTYFEKPRTTTGWKGFINDPHLDNSFDMNEGLYLARKLLLEITSMGLGVATEALEPISPQYISELISWTAIGARTTESQTHRELASGLSSPVGFKNNTDGNIDVAINAIKSASQPHHFLGIDQQGQTSIVCTMGNRGGHLILRGGKDKPNYDALAVEAAQALLAKAGLSQNLVIDCSHDNSAKDYRRQPQVFMDCVTQIKNGNDAIVGLMLESHVAEGRQDLSPQLKYGVSITDGCIDFETSAQVIREARQILKKTL